MKTTKIKNVGQHSLLCNRILCLFPLAYTTLLTTVLLQPYRICECIHIHLTCTNEYASMLYTLYITIIGLLLLTGIGTNKTMSLRWPTVLMLQVDRVFNSSKCKLKSSSQANSFGLIIYLRDRVIPHLPQNAAVGRLGWTIATTLKMMCIPRIQELQ